jgi:hypothetical protein
VPNSIEQSQLGVRAGLEQAGVTLRSRAQEMEDELLKLRSQLAPLIDVWQGEVRDYYNGLQAEWDIAAEGLLGPEGVLGTIARVMDVTWGNYVDCEWSNLQTWRN